MRRSFRLQLALRFTVAMGMSAAVISAASVLTLRSVLDGELNASIMDVASIQAASVTDSPSGEMHFHEWELTPSEAASVQDLIRYAQVWQADGRSLLRSRFMTRDLPLDREALRQAGDGELLWREADFAGVPVRSLYYPLERLGSAHQAHVLQVAAPLVARNEMVTRLAAFFAALSLLVTVGSFAGGWWLGGRTVRPVHEVIDQAEVIGGGSLDRGISAYAETQEYRRLVEVLNTMLGRIREAFGAQKRFTADASHELRSPLTAMRGELELALRRERAPDEYRRVIESTLEEVDRLSLITEHLLVLARSDAGGLKPNLTPTDPDEATARIVDRLRRRAAEKDVDIALDVRARRLLMLDAGLFGQVVWNLVDNAIKFSPSSGVVRVDVIEAGGRIRLDVTDEGPGLGSEPDKVFERFFRADESRTHAGETAGAGLGLAIVRAVAEAHGGTVAARNRRGGGAGITVVLPAEPAPRMAPTITRRDATRYATSHADDVP